MREGAGVAGSRDYRGVCLRCSFYVDDIYDMIWFTSMSRSFSFTWSTVDERAGQPDT